MDELEDEYYPGEWWLADQPDRRVAGVLRLNDEFVLNLIGSLDQDDTPPFERATLCGQCRNVNVIVPDARNLGTSETSYEQPVDTTIYRQRILCPTVLTGWHINPQSDMNYDWMRFRITHLDAWANRLPFKLDHAESDQESATFVWPEPLHASIPGAQIRIERQLSSKLDRHSAFSWESHEGITIRLDSPGNLDEMTHKYVRPLLNLITLATGNKCSTLNLSVGRGDPDSREGATQRLLVSRYKQQIFDNPPNDHNFQMRFTLSDIPFNALMSAWYDMDSNYGRACDLALSIRSGMERYLEDNMFSCASSIERIHRALFPGSDRKTTAHEDRMSRIIAAVEDTDDKSWLEEKLKHSHQPSYRERLAALVGKAGEAIHPFIGITDNWTKRVSEERNAFAHSRDNTREVIRTIRIMQSLELLISIVLFKELGLSDDQIASAISRDYEWQALASAMRADLPDLWEIRQ